MATQIKREEIMARYRDLPEDLQNALMSTSFPDSIMEVGKKHELTIDKIGELADETGLVMLGITPPGNYIQNLIKRMDVNAEKARAIAEEINQKVFQPVRESLKKIHGLGEAPKAPIQPPPPPPLSRGGAEEVKSPPLQGGVRGGMGDVKKPFPSREEIKVPAEPPTHPPPPSPREGEKEVSLPPYEGGREGLGVKGEEPKKPLEFKQVLPPIPPIFVKKLPIPDLPPKPDIVPAPKEQLPQNSLAAKTELEKALGGQAPQKTYQSNDPYREPLE